MLSGMMSRTLLAASVAATMSLATVTPLAGAQEAPAPAAAEALVPVDAAPKLSAAEWTKQMRAAKQRQDTANAAVADAKAKLDTATADVEAKQAAVTQAESLLAGLAGTGITQTVEELEKAAKEAKNAEAKAKKAYDDAFTEHQDAAAALTAARNAEDEKRAAHLSAFAANPNSAATKAARAELDAAERTHREAKATDAAAKRKYEAAQAAHRESRQARISAQAAYESAKDNPEMAALGATLKQALAGAKGDLAKAEEQRTAAATAHAKAAAEAKAAGDAVAALEAAKPEGAKEPTATEGSSTGQVIGIVVGVIALLAVVGAAAMPMLQQFLP